MLAGKFNLLKGCVYTRNSSGRAAFDDGFREYAASAANVQPAQIRGQTQPVQELICQQAAPASHPLVVGCSASPFVHTHRIAWGRRPSSAGPIDSILASPDGDVRAYLRLAPVIEIFHCLVNFGRQLFHLAQRISSGWNRLT